jgi:hypothetical protein
MNKTLNQVGFDGLGYTETPFNDPDGYEGDPQIIEIWGKPLKKIKMLETYL